MPVNTRELIEAISLLANQRNIRVTLKKSGIGALICSACSFAGGLLLGPAGLALGGAAGGLLAYNVTKDSFRSLGDVLANDLTQSQKQQLVDHIIKAVQDIHPTDIIMLLPLISSSASLQKTVLKAAIEYVSKELNVEVID